MTILNFENLLKKEIIKLVYCYKRPPNMKRKKLWSWRLAFFFAFDSLDKTRVEREVSEKNYFLILKKYAKRYNELPKSLQMNEDDIVIFKVLFSEGMYFLAEEMITLSRISVFDKFRKL